MPVSASPLHDVPASPDSRLPAYVQLRDAIAARVAQSEWEPDSALPSENQLTKETGLSVGTVRKALQMLVDEGLLERRQGLGTFLRKRAFDASLFRFFAMRAAGSTTIPSSKLLERQCEKAPANISAILKTADCIRLNRLRSQGDIVLLNEEIWLPRELFGGIETLPEIEIGPLLYPVYWQRFHVFIANAEDEVSFALPPPDVAQRLGIQPNQYAARIERQALNANGEVVEWRCAWGSAEHFRYRSRLS